MSRDMTSISHQLPCRIGIQKQASGSDFLRKRIEELYHVEKDVCFFGFQGLVVGCRFLVVGVGVVVVDDGGGGGGGL